MSLSQARQIADDALSRANSAQASADAAKAAADAAMTHFTSCETKTVQKSKVGACGTGYKGAIVRANALHLPRWRSVDPA